MREAGGVEAVREEKSRKKGVGVSVSGLLGLAFMVGAVNGYHFLL